MIEDKKISISAPIHFDHTAPNIIQLTAFGDSWPAVYIINNEHEAYIGETTNAPVRISQHLENPHRNKLDSIRILSSNTFNKSVALDLEAFLISHMSADGHFKLQNGNAGQQKHNYYQRTAYEEKFLDVWQQLQDLHLANRNLQEIENSNLFKYSPYKSLTTDQYLAVSQIISRVAKDFADQENSTFVVRGGPGTGKTVLGIYLLKLLSSDIDEDSGSDDEELIENLQRIHQKKKPLKLGIVISMTNLRNIVKDTFRQTYGLHEKMVYSPSQIANAEEDFDILIVDEAHRLRQRKNLTQYGQHDKNNVKMGLGQDGTELDWILRRSKHCILLYDQDQTVKPTDVPAEKFQALLDKTDSLHSFDLITQVRCILGGQKYLDYIKAIFSQNPPSGHTDFSSYDLRLYNDVSKMVNAIKAKDRQFGLCRTVAGYAWKWSTHNQLDPAPESSAETENYINDGLYDIEIDGHRYIWNVKYDGWLTSPNSINEIGCIHTIQGFDLNYAGVIIGNELRYDPISERLYIEPSEYYDQKGKAGVDEADLLQYILHIYQVLCTRGMSGTYIYACDKNLHEYLKKFIPEAD